MVGTDRTRGARHVPRAPWDTCHPFWGVDQPFEAGEYSAARGSRHHDLGHLAWSCCLLVACQWHSRYYCETSNLPIRLRDFAPAIS